MKDIIKKAVDHAFEDDMNGETAYDIEFSKKGSVITVEFALDAGRAGIELENSITIGLESKKVNCRLCERFEGAGMEENIEIMVLAHIKQFEGELPLSDKQEALMSCIRFGRNNPTIEGDVEFVRSIEI